MSDKRRQTSQGGKATLAGGLDIQELLGPPPLLEGEDPAAYGALRDRVRDAVEPSDAIEEFWVRDVVDLLWETLRLRRLKAAFIRASAPEGLVRLLTRLVDGYKRNDLVDRWAAREPAAVREVKALLERAGLNEAAITGQTLATKIETIERVDRLIAQSEARRNAVLREVERRREMVARRLREAANVIEDAEFREIGVLAPTAPE